MRGDLIYYNNFLHRAGSIGWFKILCIENVEVRLISFILVKANFLFNVIICYKVSIELLIAFSIQYSILTDIQFQFKKNNKISRLYLSFYQKAKTLFFKKKIKLKDM